MTNHGQHHPAQYIRKDSMLDHEHDPERDGERFDGTVQDQIGRFRQEWLEVFSEEGILKDSNQCLGDVVPDKHAAQAMDAIERAMDDALPSTHRMEQLMKRTKHTLTKFEWLVTCLYFGLFGENPTPVPEIAGTLGATKDECYNVIQAVSTYFCRNPSDSLVKKRKKYQQDNVHLRILDIGKILRRLESSSHYKWLRIAEYMKVKHRPLDETMERLYKGWDGRG